MNEENRIREMKGVLTLPDSLHLWLQQNLVLEVDDLAVVSVYDLKRRVDD